MSAKMSNKTKLADMERDRDMWKHLFQSRERELKLLRYEIGRALKDSALQMIGYKKNLAAILSKTACGNVEITDCDLKWAENINVYTKRTETGYCFEIKEKNKEENK